MNYANLRALSGEEITVSYKKLLNGGNVSETGGSWSMDAFDIKINLDMKNDKPRPNYIKTRLYNTDVVKGAQYGTDYYDVSYALLLQKKATGAVYTASFSDMLWIGAASYGAYGYTYFSSEVRQFLEFTLCYHGGYEEKLIDPINRTNRFQIKMHHAWSYDDVPENDNSIFLKEYRDKTRGIYPPPDGQRVLANIADNHPIWRVRRAAVNRLTDLTVLEEIGENDTNENIRRAAKLTCMRLMPVQTTRYKDLLNRFAQDKDIAVRLEAVSRLTDAHLLYSIGEKDEYEPAELAKAKFKNIALAIKKIHKNIMDDLSPGETGEQKPPSVLTPSYIDDLLKELIQHLTPDLYKKYNINFESRLLYSHTYSQGGKGDVYTNSFYHNGKCLYEWHGNK